ncbi:hypothetical protein K4K58_000212 [Colletotrichum sp. SAR11_239]|nr:hypothetical protein K4K58_000212 [Colletotrichum sp. SAR11_239]
MAPTVDTLIIGAGPSGLCAAKTLLQRDPSSDILLVDGRASVGGVWSQEQIYPNLKTNNFTTSIDFSDFPMDLEKYGLKEKQHVPGEVMHKYLVSYAKHFGVYDKIQLNTMVTRITRPDIAEWYIDVEQNGEAKTVSCNRLIVATGVLTVPHMPEIEGSDEFNAPMIHSSNLGPRKELFEDPDIQTVAVLGGSKSAYDSVHLAASTGHKTHEKTKVLQPEQNQFWYGTASGILSFDDDFFEYVRNGTVEIYREDIDHLSDHRVHLADGTSFSVDLLVASTGFSAKPTMNFEPASLHSELGVPTAEMSPDQVAFWNEQSAKADKAIGARFPRLLDGPFLSPTSSKPKPFNPGASVEVSYSPWRLYRGMAPPGLAANDDRSLIFLGVFSNLANIMRLEVQCLWALAYFEGKIPTLDRDIRAGKVYEETALMQRWAQHRAPYGHGRQYTDIVFDQLPYWDMLLGEVGVQTQRKPSKWAEFWESYTPVDYRGMVKEWMAQNPKLQNGKV